MHFQVAISTQDSIAAYAQCVEQEFLAFIVGTRKAPEWMIPNRSAYRNVTLTKRRGPGAGLLPLPPFNRKSAPRANIVDHGMRVLATQ